MFVFTEKPAAFLTTKLTEQPSRKATKEDEFDAIPIYCAALGAVVLGLLGYVFFKQYSRLKDKNRHKIHDPHDHVEYSRASGGTDSGVCVDFTVQCKTCKRSKIDATLQLINLDISFSNYITTHRWYFKANFISLFVHFP